MVDAALHYAMPLLMVVFWALAVRPDTLKWRDAPGLFAYPLAYLVYVFLRGEVFGLYPYEFVDVLKLGYSPALRNAGGMLLAYAAIVGMLCGLKARWFWRRNKLEAL